MDHKGRDTITYKRANTLVLYLWQVFAKTKAHAELVKTLFYHLKLCSSDNTSRALNADDDHLIGLTHSGSFTAAKQRTAET